MLPIVLWVVTTPAPVNAGLMKPDANGAVNAIFTTPAGVLRPTAMAVTIEPDGGVPRADRRDVSGGSDRRVVGGWWLGAGDLT